MSTAAQTKPSTASHTNPKPAKAPAGSPVKRLYLTLYNAVSCGLWAVILYRVVSVLVENYTKEPFLGTVKRKENAWYETGEFVKWVQTGALLEVVHSLLGIVRAPVTTTALQVASRVVLVWGICDQFPSVPANSLFYSSMLVAWSVTEVVRYGFFVFSLNGFVPGVLSWLRYNLFFVLYPLGISSEMALVYKSIPLAKKRDERLEYVMYAILGIYFPGAYILYTHMMAQRKRVMRGKAKTT
ncbi:uncharacterized protein PV09_05151 [Verruconis gallopava]|uniref:Very-long-chain (3R)-3-hydroxyacyl-CoA dehydratase n=1 Tax=Verruconis gallopava TaxID=253628 RepID=A0A0D1YT88_9PEZI|nr:uncharacterized protein PV09_05151 [Verruconis gallopava]KIW03852.1 hypothetical protein PV09_05151 [Verruconis gallopava]